jgi:hypothetical protein
MYIRHSGCQMYVVYCCKRQVLDDCIQQTMLLAATGCYNTMYTS